VGKVRGLSQAPSKAVDDRGTQGNAEELSHRLRNKAATVFIATKDVCCT